MAKKTETATEKTPKAETTTALDKKAQTLFAEYPEKQEVYFTSDSLAFFLECDAKNHAYTLKDAQVTTIKKQQ